MTNKKKKKSLKIISLLLSIVLIAGIVYFGIKIYQEVKQTNQLKKEYEQSMLLFEQVKKENVDLKEQKEKLEDPEYVKSYARGQYMLSKEGEQIFYLPVVEEGK